MKSNFTLENKIAFKKANAISNRIIRKSKRDSWKNFLSSINSQTTPKDLWGKLNALKGKNKNKSISSIKIGDNTFLDKKGDIANALAKNYQNISDGKNGREAFKAYRDGKNKNIDFSSDVRQVYNLPHGDRKPAKTCQTC